MLRILFLQATTGQQNPILQFLPFIGIAIVFYFFMFRPQQKRQKDQKLFRDALKSGDRIVTIGGLHGKIVEVKDDTIVLDVDRGTKLTFDKTSVSQEASKRFQDTTTATTTTT